jgi:hypothetical protein
MAQGQASQQGATVAAAQNVFVKAASSSKIDSNTINSTNYAPRTAEDGQIYAAGACNNHVV